METTLTFASLDGTELVGTMHVPKGSSSYSALMVHGLPSNRDEWGFYRDFAVALGEQGITSLRFDLRFNGDSAHGNFSGLTLGQLACDVEAAYRELVRQTTTAASPVVVGTSCGGGIAIRWASSFRREANKLFLMAPVLDYVYEVAGLRAESGEIPSPRFVSEVRNRAASGVKLNEEIGYGLPMLCDALTFDSVRELQCVRRSTTIFHGTADSVVPFEISRRVSELVPSVQLIPIAEADHGFAVKGDDDLTHPGTKANHQFIYQQVLLRLGDD